ncbi:hypothetical protein GCM10009525_07700 [Streptosporangium amethystogenes subsp. fukuiense]
MSGNVRHALAPDIYLAAVAQRLQVFLTGHRPNIIQRACRSGQNGGHLGILLRVRGVGAAMACSPAVRVAQLSRRRDSSRPSSNNGINAPGGPFIR